MINENKNKVKAILGATLFHIGMLVLLLLLALRTPLPLPGEEGVLVNLGYDVTGMGIDQQEQAAPAEVLPQPKPVEQEMKEDEYLVQDIEEAPVIKEKKVEKKKKAPEKVIKKAEPEPVKEVIRPEPKPEPKPQPDPKAMYKGKSTSSTQGGQEGQTGQPGDQGNPNGTRGVPNYIGNGGEGAGTGTGSGTGSGPGDGAGDGISYSLGGRGSKMLDKPSYDSKEQGKVVVTIKVDRQGNVVSAVAGAKGTNVSDQTLWQLAKDAALRSRFEADPNAPDMQVGTITYNFIRQN